MATLGIYIQVPFCASKCSFCNFSSRVVSSSWFESYSRVMAEEIERLPVILESEGIGKAILDLPVDTIYVGGGTPSLLGANRVGAIFEALRRRVNLERLAEFTLELTPGSADDEFLVDARAMGVNRLSVGAQSFHDRELRSVGRLHSADDTRGLVRRARHFGFRNLSLDLIAGLPYQTMPAWVKSLCRAIELRPEHLSVYLFEVDEKSRLGREVLNKGSRYHASFLPGEDFMAEAYDVAREVLGREGYRQYEISNFALAGYESLHNRKYWRLEPYVGLGAGAHSFSGLCRWANEPEVGRYAAKLTAEQSPIAEFHHLSPEEQLEEFFFLGLRQSEGVDLMLASDRWGPGWLARWEETISNLTKEGWLERKSETVRLKESAYLISNQIFQEFLVQ